MVFPTEMNYTAGVLIYKDNQVLAFKDKKKKGWDIPKGNVDNEAVKRAAIRETFEETKIEVPSQHLEYYGSYYWDYNKRIVLFTIDYDKVSYKSNKKHKFKDVTDVKFYPKLRKVLQQIKTL